MSLVTKIQELATSIGDDVKSINDSIATKWTTPTLTSGKIPVRGASTLEDSIMTQNTGPDGISVNGSMSMSSLSVYSGGMSVQNGASAFYDGVYISGRLTLKPPSLDFVFDETTIDVTHVSGTQLDIGNKVKVIGTVEASTATLGTHLVTKTQSEAFSNAIKARSTHTGTQLASTISDIQATISANSSVTANTAKVTNAAHYGDVSGSGVLIIASNAVTNAKLYPAPTLTIKGNSTGSTGAVADLTVATVKTMLGIDDLALDSTVVKITGAQNISGIKTFTEKIKVNDVIQSGTASATSGSILLKARYGAEIYPAQALITEYSSGGIGLSQYMYQDGSADWLTAYSGSIGRGALMVTSNTLKFIATNAQTGTEGVALATQPSAVFNLEYDGKATFTDPAYDSIIIEPTGTPRIQATRGAGSSINLYNPANGDMELTTNFASGDISLNPGTTGNVTMSKSLVVTGSGDFSAGIVADVGIQVDGYITGVDGTAIWMDGLDNNGIDFGYVNGGYFRTAEASIKGTNDVFFQALPATSAGYGFLESYFSAGMIVGTGGNTSPVIFQVNRVEKARITTTGFGVGITPTEALHVSGNGLFTGDVTTSGMVYDTAYSTFNSLGNLGATETVDFATNQHQYGTLDANTTITISGIVDGQNCQLMLKYDATAQRTVAWSGVTYWIGGTAPANGPDAAGYLICTFVKIGSDIVGSFSIAG